LRVGDVDVDVDVDTNADADVDTDPACSCGIEEAFSDAVLLSWLLVELHIVVMKCSFLKMNTVDAASGTEVFRFVL